MKIVITEEQLKKLIDPIILNETYGELEKHYLKTGLYDDEDRNVIMNITGGDNWTKLIADMYKYLANKYNPTVEPKRLDARDINILRDAHAMLKRYNKNVFPLKDIFAKDYYTHPLGIRNDLDLRELIIKKLKLFPTILLRNLRDDIRKERNEYEFKELWEIIKQIETSLKLLNNVNPEQREKIIKKIFSSKFTTFDEIKRRLEDTTIPYLSEESGMEELISKVEDMGDEAEIIYNENNILVVVIKSPEAMRYIGCSSQWCFATGGDDYWDQYASQGYATIVFNHNIYPSEPTRMVVVLEDGSVYDMYNEYMDDGDAYLQDIGVLNIIPNGELMTEGKSKYHQCKESLMKSKNIPKEMKAEILKYITGGSTYHEGGRVVGLSKPNVLREKSPKSDGVSMGADKNGFYVYTHRARSKSHATPDKITVKEIEFIDSTG